jgi:hypothetical protein
MLLGHLDRWRPPAPISARADKRGQALIAVGACAAPPLRELGATKKGVALHSDNSHNSSHAPYSLSIVRAVGLSQVELSVPVVSSWLKLDQLLLLK